MLVHEQGFEYREALAASLYFVLAYLPYSIRRAKDEDKFNQDILASADTEAMPNL